ncbi:MAG: hypothetical protein ACK5V3_00345 [Bdellovibrionales bacterium]
MTKDSVESSVTQREFFKSFQQKNREIEFGTLGTIDFRDFQLFGQPNEASLKEQATDLAKKLLKEEPLSRYIISYDLNVEKLKWKRFSKKFRVQKVLSPSVGSLVVLDVSDEEMHKKEFVLSAENILSVMEGMRFNNKLTTFSGIKKLNSPWSSFLADAMIRDLIAEQNVALSVSQGRWELIKRTMGGLFTGRRFNSGSDISFAELEKLKVNSQLSVVNKAGQELLRVVAALKFYAKNALGMFHILEKEKFVSPLSVYLYRRDMNRLQEQIVTKNFPNEMTQAKALVDQHVSIFEERLKKRQAALKGNSRLKNSHNMLTNPSLSSTYSTPKILNENLVQEEEN